MKICIVGTAINPIPSNIAWTGIESLCQYLVKGLVELGQEVTLISVEGSLWKNWDKIELIEIPVKGPDVEQSFYEGYREYVKGFEGVVHDHSNGKMARLVNPRTLGTMHWLQTPLAMGYRNVVCISNAHRKWTVAQYPLNLRAEGRGPAVVYNGIDQSMFPLSKDHGEELLFFSVLGPYKGADTVLNLALKHPEYRFGFGGRNTTYSDVVKKAAETHPNITFYGEVSHDEKKRIMGGAKALLQLAKPFNRRDQYPFMDIFPLTLCEANLCGTPVIGLAIDGVAEMIGDGENGVLCGSVPEVEVALVGFAGGLVSIPPESCRGYAEKRFSHIRMARDYVNLYRRVEAGDFW